MNDLIKIEKQVIGEEEVNAVNARELHVFLGVETKFADWIKRRIKEYDFAQDTDFISFLKKEKAQNAYINTKEYIISVSMAKELSMVERNAKGKDARKYFIEMEKIAKGGVKNLTPAEQLLVQAQFNVDTERRQLAIEQSQRKTEVAILETKQKIDELESKMCSNPGYFTVTGYANLMKVSVTTQEANKIGRKAAKLSRESNTAIGKSSHERWGEVNTYHENILQAIFPRK